MSRAPGDITLMLAAIGRGDRQAAGQLLPLVYEELRTLARARLAHVPPGNTLQPTALVHEAYLRLVGTSGDASDPGWQGRAHFFGAAAQAMRDILVEQARRKSRLKHGGGRARAALDDAVDDQHVTPLVEAPPELLSAADDMLALDDALRKLEAEDPRKASVVMLKYFAGLEHPMIAEFVGVSLPTVDRDLRFARAWLAKQMQARRAGGDSETGLGGAGDGGGAGRP